MQKIRTKVDQFEQQVDDDSPKGSKKYPKCPGITGTPGSHRKSINRSNDFFLEYSPKHLHRRLLLENALDAQAQKIRARYIIEQEARAASEKLRERQTAAGGMQGEQWTAWTSPRRKSSVFSRRSGGIDLAELDHDDSQDELGTTDPSDEDEWSETPVNN